MGSEECRSEQAETVAQALTRLSKCASKSSFGFVVNSGIVNVSVPLPVVQNVPALVAQFVFLAFVPRTKGTRLLTAMQLVGSS